MLKQPSAFSNQCDGQINANNVKGKAGSLEEGQDGKGQAIS